MDTHPNNCNGVLLWLGLLSKVTRAEINVGSTITRESTLEVPSQASAGTKIEEADIFIRRNSLDDVVGDQVPVDRLG